MPYQVGQVLFVILNKKMQVYPMLIVEEITKKTMQGEETNYVLQGGADPHATVLLNKVDGEVFTSAKEAKNVLIERATVQIEKLIEAAVEKSAEWYSQPASIVPQKIEQPSMEKPEEESSVRVQLPDGTFATFKGKVG